MSQLLDSILIALRAIWANKLRSFMTVLGNIVVGKCSRIAAGSVVLQAVPPCKTVAGVPARVVGEAGCAEPSKTMDQLIRSTMETE